MADASVGGGGGRAASSGSTATPGDEAATTSSSTAKKGGAGGTRRETINLKVAMLGDPATGKTTLMYKYCTGKFDEDYLVTMGISFMEKTVKIRNADINFTIWDLGGQDEFKSMMPMCCNDALAILFIFDLSRKSTLASIRKWFKESRRYSKAAVPILVGTKFDVLTETTLAEQTEITTQARRFAKAMKAPLIFTSSSHSVGITKLFKIVLSKVFQLKCNVEELHEIGEPICEYGEQPADAAKK